MPRSRGSEMPQRQSPRGPPHLRTSNTDADPLHHRPITDRSPKLADRRSPRGQPDAANQKKLGTRIADLESQLGQAQEELKSLKEQLASAESAKKEAQQELENKSSRSIAPEPVKTQAKHSSPIVIQNSNQDTPNPCQNHDENQQETEIFEVPVEKATVEPQAEYCQPSDPADLKNKEDSVLAEAAAIPVPEKPFIDELTLQNDEITSLEAKLEEKEKDLEVISKENVTLKNQLIESASQISSAKATEEEMTLKLNQLGKELEVSQANAAQLKQKLEAVDGAKEALETEMKKLRVQTEQWRKAADAAASVLAGGIDIKGRRLSERCGSMDKHYGSAYDAPVGGYAGFVGSPGYVDESDDGFGTVKRKGSGIRMFGDLWRKKGHK